VRRARVLPPPGSHSEANAAGEFTVTQVRTLKP